VFGRLACVQEATADGANVKTDAKRDAKKAKEPKKEADAGGQEEDSKAGKGKRDAKKAKEPKPEADAGGQEEDSKAGKGKDPAGNKAAGSGASEDKKEAPTPADSEAPDLLADPIATLGCE
jgi:hypothetical protein